MDGSTGYVGRDRVARYTGSGPGVGPENQVMISGQYLAWSSDAFVSNGGFVICLTETDLPGLSPALSAGDT